MITVRALLGATLAAAVLRDRAAIAGATSDVVEAQTVVHEIGHQVLESGDHTPHTIMNETLPVPTAEEKFGPQDIANIRDSVSSPGWL